MGFDTIEINLVLPETDSKIRALYHYIADGTLCTNEWYRDLENPSESTNVAEPHLQVLHTIYLKI